MIKDERGVGMKATDRWVIPLTWDEHAELHTHGSREHDAWFAERGLADPYELARQLWENRRDPEKMRLIVEMRRP
jgi:hypothetical protein